MDGNEFKDILLNHLAPVLGAEVDDTIHSSTSRERTVAYVSPSEIAIKPSSEDDYRVVIKRTPAFTSEEHKLVQDFVEELIRFHNVDAGDYKAELFSYLPMRAICRHLGDSKSIRKILFQYDLWSARTYEGQPITASIGIDSEAEDGQVSLDEIFEHDFSAVLTNGFDTLMVVTSDGKMCRSGQLDSNNSSNYAPYRLRHIANWTEGNNIAVVLNRLGEQLIFRDKKLLFAKRRGAWMYYSHEKTVAQMSPPGNRELREALYESCIDVSYARSGGCIGVVKSGNTEDVSTYLSDEDRLSPTSGSVKSKALHAMVTEKKFQDMDRRLRQELLALDGAMVLSHRGEVLAVGAIISVPSGSDSGGRRAAALQLSELGLGIKVSEDGEIVGFMNKEKRFAT